MTALGAMATPVEPWSSTLTALEADERFQLAPAMTAALVHVDGSRVAVLTRTRVHLLMTGPKGYGRALHSRSTVTALLPDESLVVDADATVVEGAQAALCRPVESRYDDLAVEWSDGTFGLLPVSRLMEELAKEFATVALHDPLTRLPNRAALRQRMDMLRNECRQFALILLDLDGFKAVNDRFGHHAGDDVLIETAGRLRREAPQDLVVRLGGDEFVILVTSRPEPPAVQALSARLVTRLADPVDIDGGHVGVVGASIGAVVAAYGDHPLADPLKAADKALYEAKRAGRGCMRWGQLDSAQNPRGHARVLPAGATATA